MNNPESSVTSGGSQDEIIRTNQQREKRGTSGCTICRIRKVRCGEQKPTCLQCSRLRLECNWNKSSENANAHVPKTRGSGACEPCRQRKFKCTREAPGSKCIRCIKKHLDCVSHKRLVTEELGSSPAMSPQQQIFLNDKARVRRLIERYFTTVYHFGYHNFIHRQAYLNLLERNQAPKELSYLMIACALRFESFTPDSETLAEADQWADAASTVLLSRIHRGFGAVHLMSMVLLHFYESTRGNASSAWLISGQAARMAQFLKLHTLDITYANIDVSMLPPLFSQESLRRLVWAVFIIDTIEDAGVYGENALATDALQVHLPNSEAAFSLSEPSFELSLESLVVQWITIRRKLLHYASRANQTMCPLAQQMIDTEALHQELVQLEASIPFRFTDTDNPYHYTEPQAALFAYFQAIRHGCFHISGRTKIGLLLRQGSHDNDCATLRRERISRAESLAKIAGHLIDHHVRFSPGITPSCYVYLEVLLLDPGRLLTGTDSHIRVSSFDQAITSLLKIIRLSANTSSSARMLQVEACYRMFKCGYTDLLEPGDWEAINKSYPYAGQDPNEFNFPQRQDERIERFKRGGRAAPDLAHDTLLRLGEPATRPPSPGPVQPTISTAPDSQNERAASALSAEPAQVATQQGPLFDNEMTYNQIEYDYQNDWLEALLLGQDRNDTSTTNDSGDPFSGNHRLRMNLSGDWIWGDSSV